MTQYSTDELYTEVVQSKFFNHKLTNVLTAEPNHCLKTADISANKQKPFTAVAHRRMTSQKMTVIK